MPTATETVSYHKRTTANLLTFGELLHQLRRRAGMTQADLAAAVDFSISHISNLEKNQRLPSVALVLEKFVPALGLQDEPRLAQQLIDGAAQARGEWPVGIQTSQSPSLSASQPTPPATPTTLPLPLLPMLGRDHELTVIRNRLLGHQGRLFTLVGPPGIGKTTLGLAVTARLQVNFHHGAYFVPLAPVTEPTLVGAAMMNVLGLTDSSGRTPQARLIDYLRHKQTLLFLDNFEQVMDATPLLISLLQECPSLVLLVTSRSALRVRAEQRFKVAALPPDEAALLFIQRAQAVDPDFQVSAEKQPLIAQICQHLDYLPLAIELIAAQIHLFTPEELFTRLHSYRLDLLQNDAPDLEPRHQTLRRAIHHSYVLLTAEEQAFFRQLGVFSGGFDLATLEAIWAQYAPARTPAPQLLSTLVNKSLVQTEPQARYQRFRLLETLRDYALEQLQLQQEEEAARRRHAEYFCELATTANPLFRGPDEILWLDRLEANHANLRSALAWSLIAEKDLSIGLRLVAMLWWFWYARSYMREGLEWLQRALAKDTGQLPAVRAKLLQGAGRFVTVNHVPNHRQLARIYIEESIALYRQLDDPWNLAKSLAYVGNYATTPEEFASAAAEAKAIFQQINDYWGLAWVPVMECLILQPSIQHLPMTESVRLMRTIGAKFGLALTLQAAALQAQERDDYEVARRYVEESIAIYHQTGDKWTKAYAYLLLGRILTAQNQMDGLVELYTEGLLLAQQSGSTYLVEQFTHRLDTLAQVGG